MATKTVRLLNYYERDVPVDDATAEASVPVRIRRFTSAQLLDFKRGWDRCQNPSHEAHIYRKPDESEVPMPEVRRRRIDEMSPEQRAAFHALEREDEDHQVAFCCQQIRDHVWVSPDADVVIANEGDGVPVPVRTGSDLVAVFGGNLSMLLLLTGYVLVENTLSAEKKRAWLRPSGLSTSSAVPQGAGPIPVETAGNVVPPVSASHAAALDPSAPSPSTETA